MNINLYDSYMLHTRKGYGALEIVGDLGGVIEVFLFCLAFLVRPFSVFSFNMKALQKMFLAKTYDKTLFASKKKNTLAEAPPNMRMSMIFQ